ncbi:MAG: TetR family transcriptional regulator [Actinomycetota bacterium]
MRTEQAQATRDHLLEVATRLFAERGYDGTSIETVLKEAGVSRGALYHHFASKESLFEAVYELAQDRVAREIAEEARGASDALGMIKAGARAWLHRVRDPVVRQITLIDAPAVLGWQRWREIDEKHFLGIIRTALSGAAGDAIPTERLDLLAHVYFGMLVEMAMVIARSDQSDAAIEEAAKLVDDFLTRMLS